MNGYLKEMAWSVCFKRALWSVIMMTAAHFLLTIHHRFDSVHAAVQYVIDQ